MVAVHPSERGVAIVEAAIILPLFLLVLIGTLEFGLIFNDYLTLHNATREGARLGAVGVDAGTVEVRVRDFASTLHQDELTVTVTNAQGSRGTAVTVNTAYPVPLITPLMQRVVGESAFVLTAEASMRLE